MTRPPIYFAYPGDLHTPTGGYHYDRRLIAALHDLGLTVHTLSLPDRFPYADEEALHSSRQLFADLPDEAVVIVDGLAFGVLDELAAAEAQRLRMVALCHHPLALESGLDEAQREAFTLSEQRALQQARAVLVTSPHTGKILSDSFNVPAAKIRIALPGTDPVPFAACDGDPVRLLTVGSLIPRKAHDVLIDALAPLVDRAWTARFVGSGSFDPGWAQRLAERVNRRRLNDRIHLVGPLECLRAEYQGADLFVLPSRFEGYGMVFAEALAAGLPIVAARAGAVPDVVPAAAGLLVPPDDVDALSAALARLLDSQDLRRQLQQGARAAAANLPTWRDSADRVAQLISEVQQA